MTSLIQRTLCQMMKMEILKTPRLNVDDDDFEKTEVKDLKQMLEPRYRLHPRRVLCHVLTKEIFNNNHSLKRDLTRKHPSIDSSSYDTVIVYV